MLAPEAQLSPFNHFYFRRDCIQTGLCMANKSKKKTGYEAHRFYFKSRSISPPGGEKTVTGIYFGIFGSVTSSLASCLCRCTQVLRGVKLCIRLCFACSFSVLQVPFCCPFMVLHTFVTVSFSCLRYSLLCPYRDVSCAWDCRKHRQATQSCWWA